MYTINDKYSIVEQHMHKTNINLTQLYSKTNTYEITQNSYIAIKTICFCLHIFHGLSFFHSNGFRFLFIMHSEGPYVFSYYYYFFNPISGKVLQPYFFCTAQ